ncbi:unnamed protein product [Notodromas monacha]|uniref:Uncharacterized protein n=1 Tax=Notodromas monacha TaxID=399045 RepID=A0A7R9GDK0_9CRUS|nr:unnamed protein product [Notodromas monacha]CAG0917298.1 unnamed protein product [Notodromas monacha]
MGVAASRKSIDISSKVAKDASDEPVAVVPEDAKVSVSDSLERNADGATVNPERKETPNTDESAEASNNERTEDETNPVNSVENKSGTKENGEESKGKKGKKKLSFRSLSFLKNKQKKHQNDEATPEDSNENVDISAEQVTGTNKSEEDNEQKSTQKSEVNANSDAEVKAVAFEKVPEDSENRTAIPDETEEAVLGEEDRDIGINSAVPPTDPPPPPPPLSDHEDA